MKQQTLAVAFGGICLLMIVTLLLLASPRPSISAGTAAAAASATSTVPCRKGAGSSRSILQPCGTETPATTPTSTLSPSPTWTPTSMPGPPTLIAPADRAILPQPVPPASWYFVWVARQGPCYGTISIRGPGGRSIVDENIPAYPAYSFTYTITTPLPDDALAPWYWDVGVICPMGSNHSETRTFSVTPADGTWEFYLPIVLKSGYDAP